MKALLLAASISVFGLGYLTHDPGPVADLLRSWDGHSHRKQNDSWYDRVQKSAEEGNPFGESAFGLSLLKEVPLKHDADPERGRALVESAASKGLSSSLFFLWMFTGSDDGALLDRAAELGDPLAIKTVLTRAVRAAECLPDGRAKFSGPLPTLESLHENRKRLASVRETYGVPRFMAEDYPGQIEAMYSEAEEMLDRVHDGMACTPEAATAPADSGS